MGVWSGVHEPGDWCLRVKEKRNKWGKGISLTCWLQEDAKMQSSQLPGAQTTQLDGKTAAAERANKQLEAVMEGARAAAKVGAKQAQCCMQVVVPFYSICLVA
eukprot:1146791-Pelagomonas_calceolata.AAC.2